MAVPFKQSQGEVFIQLLGPGADHTLVSLGQCTDLEDIVEPRYSGTPIICRDTKGNFIQVAESLAPPGKVTTSINILSSAVRSALEKVTCSYSLYVVQKHCGTKGSYTDAEMVTILSNARNEQHTYGSMVAREGDAASTFAAQISAWFPVERFVGAAGMTVERITTPGVLAYNDIAMNEESECDPGCGTPVNTCDVGMITVASSGAATPDQLYSGDAGAAWAITATDPAFGNFNSVTVDRFLTPAGIDRFLVGREGLGAAVQGQMAYSDDNGATWTTVSIGGAAAGFGPIRNGGVFALDYNHIWVVGDAGYIYFSDDGGATYTVQDAGVVAAGDYSQVKFIDALRGVAVNQAADVVAITTDGGAHWAAATPTGAGTGLLCVDLFEEDKILAGDDAGNLWYSDDFGTSWAEITGFTGTGVGTIQDVKMVSNNIGWMINADGAGLCVIQRTFDGGNTWTALANPASTVNVGLNALAVCDANNAFAVGEAMGGFGVLFWAHE